ncbi:MAG: hypothetical protein ACREO5_03430 [Candidatus Binatia bacterium]
MSEYFHVEKLFLDQFATLGWTVIDQRQGLMHDPLTGRVRVKVAESEAA